LKNIVNNHAHFGQIAFSSYRQANWDVSGTEGTFTAIQKLFSNLFNLSLTLKKPSKNYTFLF